MKRSKVLTSSLTFAAILLSALSGIAGPPLICHPIDIGNAESLPWSDSLNLTGSSNYDVKNLVADTLALLNPSTPVLVRMETLRRATIYAQRDPVVSKELLVKLNERAKGAAPDSLAWFDYGYLIECTKQANWSFRRVSDSGAEKWVHDDHPNAAANLDGYAWVVKAIGARGNDPQMEFAAALILLGQPSDAAREEHVRKALAGAKSDPLLSRNLEARFAGARSDTIAGMLTKGSN